VLVVQVVEIHWTKATRGAPRANERTALPRAFPIDSSDDNCLVQHYRLDEASGFAATLVNRESLARIPRTVGVLQIVEHPDGTFGLGISGTPGFGQPTRSPMRNVVRLTPGGYVRIALNARHASTHGQFYAETVFNVACGDAVRHDRFLVNAPDHDLDLKATLF
jgi:hypothetical protein